MPVHDALGSGANLDLRECHKFNSQDAIKSMNCMSCSIYMNLDDSLKSKCALAQSSKGFNCVSEKTLQILLLWVREGARLHKTLVCEIHVLFARNRNNMK